MSEPTNIESAIAEMDASGKDRDRAYDAYVELKGNADFAHDKLRDLLVEWCKEQGFELSTEVVVGDWAFHLTRFKDGEIVMDDRKIHQYPGRSYGD